MWPAHRVSEFERYAVDPGDVVLAMDRPWIEAGLKYGVVQFEDVPCLLVQRVARLRGTSDLSQRYLVYVIGSPAFTHYVQAVQTGTAVPHISGSQIAGFRFPLPGLDEQERIASVLAALDEKIDSNRRLAGVLEETVKPMRSSRHWIATVQVLSVSHEHWPSSAMLSFRNSSPGRFAWPIRLTTPR